MLTHFRMTLYGVVGMSWPLTAADMNYAAFFSSLSQRRAELLHFANVTWPLQGCGFASAEFIDTNESLTRLELFKVVPQHLKDLKNP